MDDILKTRRFVADYKTQGGKLAQLKHRLLVQRIIAEERCFLLPFTSKVYGGDIKVKCSYHDTETSYDFTIPGRIVQFTWSGLEVRIESTGDDNLARIIGNRILKEVVIPSSKEDKLSAYHKVDFNHPRTGGDLQ